ncbi:hypothetical protein EIP86_000566 [Pleurotus ostreatoroseus]|nr:hypothetical protein EIP86_000566 [Pleurotus ostreatoroseus]
MSFTIPSKQKVLVVPTALAPFEITEADVPKPEAGNVLIHEESVGLNPADWKIQEFDPFKSEYPFILGFEAAGTVVQLGEGVSSLAVGDKVFFPAWGGAFQQYISAPAEFCTKVPSNFTIDQAAAVPLAFNTAAVGLYCQPGDRGGAALAPFWQDGGRGKYAGQPILILGGSTSICQPTIQFARLSGFSPIITTASPKNTTLLKSLGATHVLDRNLSGEAFASAVREILAGKQLHVVFEGASDATILRAAFDLLAPGGKLVACQNGGQNLTPEQHANKEKQVIFPLGSPSYSDDRHRVCVSLYKHLPELFDTGIIKPNHVEVVPGGWNGALAGLKRMKEGGVSAQKLVVHPFETA